MPIKYVCRAEYAHSYNKPIWAKGSPFLNYSNIIFYDQLIEGLHRIETRFSKTKIKKLTQNWTPKSCHAYKRN